MVYYGTLLLFYHDYLIMTEHPKFSTSMFRYDVGVIILSEELTLDESVRAVTTTVPQRWKEKQLIKRNNCIVYGWGYDESMQFTNVVNKAKAIIMDHEYCQSQAEEYDIVFYKSQLCSTFLKSATTCRGDSGSPLVCYDKNDDAYQIGWVEYGDCTEIAGFTRIVSYTKWVKKHAG